MATGDPGSGQSGKPVRSQLWAGSEITILRPILNDKVRSVIVCELFVSAEVHMEIESD